VKAASGRKSLTSLILVLSEPNYKARRVGKESQTGRCHARSLSWKAVNFGHSTWDGDLQQEIGNSGRNKAKPRPAGRVQRNSGYCSPARAEV
jgi:hypothetical protein